MELTELKWPDVEALNKDTPVVIPIAAHEQHGRHMPLHTDSLLLGEIVRRAEERLGDDALLNDNQLTEVKGLEKLTQLTFLSLNDNPDLTKAQITELQKALPKCRIVSNPKK